MTDTCHACDQPAHNGYLCRDHVRWLRRDLTDLPALVDDLNVTLTRQDRVTARTEGGHSQDQPLPLSLPASSMLGHIRATLVGWVRVIAEDNQLNLPHDTIPAMTLWLHDHLREIQVHEAAGELASEIRDLHRRGTAVLQPRDRSRITVGPCPEVIAPSDDTDAGAGEACPGEVTAYIPADESESPVMRCSACRTEWDSPQWLRAGLRIVGRRQQIDRQKRMAHAVLGRTEA